MNLETIMIIVPLLIVVGGLSLTLGFYISSQIKYHIRKNIMTNNMKRYDKLNTKNKTKEI